MASISKLSIRGVRSFSPDGDEQVIAFCFPLTIIVGQNGCGKTTIIESLKYAVTGSLPPAQGSKSSGQAFVHDPKSYGSTNVKANIKLRFTNRAGNSMVVVRSMELTQKKTTLSFKALDGILRTTDPTTGERVSMSHKCGELDRQIPQLMGVGKAILEHVVFCHQEDSNWPLREGSELKKRFDDIFDSTRYAKALEAIQKTRKKYVAVSKELKVDLASLNSHKFAAEGFRKELEGTEEQASSVKDSIEDYDEKIKEASQKIEYFSKILDNIDDLSSSRSKIQSEMKMAQSNLNTLKDTIAQDLTHHNVDELEAMQRQSDDAVKQKADEFDKKHLLFDNLTKQIHDSRGKMQQLIARQGGLSSERDAYERVVGDRARVIDRTAKEYNISIPSSGGEHMSEHGIVGFREKLMTKRQLMVDDIAELKSAHQRDEDAFQCELSEMMAQMRTKENQQKKAKEEQYATQTEINRISAQAASSRIRKNDIDNAKRRAEEAATERDKFVNDPRIKSNSQEIGTHESEIDRINRTIEDDNGTLAELRSCSKLQDEVKMLEDQVARDEERLQEIYSDNSHQFGKYELTATANDLNSLETLANSARDLKKQYTVRKRDADKKFADKQNECTKARTLLDHSNRQGALKRKQMSMLKPKTEQMKNVVAEIRRYQSENFTDDVVSEQVESKELLDVIEKSLKECSVEGDQAAMMKQLMKMLKNMSKVKDADGVAIGVVCPCCTRPMNNEETASFLESMDVLIDPERSDILRRIRARTRESAIIRDNLERWRGTVLKCMSDWNTCRRLNNECNELEEDVKKQRQEYTDAESIMKECERQVKKLSSKLADMEQLLSEATRLRDDATKISEMKNDIHQKKGRVQYQAPTSNGRTLQEVEASVAKLSGDKEMLLKSIQNLHRDNMKLNHQIVAANKQAAEAENLLREKETKFARDREASERKVVLQGKINSLEEEDRKLQTEIAPLRQKLMEKGTDKDRMRFNAKAQEDEMNEKLTKYTKYVNKFRDLSSQIDNYLGSNKAEDLENVANDIQRIDEQIRDAELTGEDMETELEEYKQELDNSGSRKKLIEDNIRLCEFQDKIEVLERKGARIQEEIEALSGFDTSSQELRDAESKKLQFEMAKSRCEGQLSNLKEAARQLKRKLNTEEYKDIDERHRVRMIEHETTLIAVSDLEKYHRALDKALLRYHGMKITDINKIIRELWLICYKGEDITNIELVSDGGSKASKSYNYRVVMTKGNTPLDMRGRCSAGQRVLAAIVIRLALAETFCLNCGVMALDEPTTNLDYENKNGLAIALAQIIANRASQSNFQLVVITHDEDFVAMMKNELAATAGTSMPERYFQVSREKAEDGKYYSKINALDWDEI